MLAKARMKAPQQRFVRCDLERSLPFGDQSFDKVVCAQALKHIPNLVPTFTEFARVLKPMGELVFSVGHPEMYYDGYNVVNGGPGFDINVVMDNFPYQRSDYNLAIDKPGLRIDRVVELPVGPTIESMLTPDSYAEVKGRLQILAMRLRRDR